jgi:hypothetical protein
VNEVQTTLKKALELLGPNGENWIKGRAWEYRKDNSKAYCSDGALNEAARNTDQYFKAAHALEKAMPTHPQQVNYVFLNDKADTEFSQIKRLFETAIEKAAEEQ